MKKDKIRRLLYTTRNFIKKFIKSYKENININNLNQYLKQDADNFYQLSVNIFNYISLFKNIFSENNLSNEIKKEDKDDNNEKYK